MALAAETLDRGRAGVAGPPAPAAAHLARRRWLDRWAARVVVAGGGLVIGSILAILVVLGAEVVPLFRAPRARELPGPTFGTAPAVGAAFGVDEYREVAFVLGSDGRVHLRPLGRDGGESAVDIAGLGPARVTAVGPLGRSRYLLGTSDGRTIPLTVEYRVAFADGRRTVTAEPGFGPPEVVDPDGRRPVRRLAAAGPGSDSVTAVQVGPRDLVVRLGTERKALVGAARRAEVTVPLSVEIEGEVTALAMDGRGEDLVVGTSRGEVIRYDLRDRTRPVRAETASAASRAVTVLGFLLGDRTLVVADAGGGVSTWQVVRSEAGEPARLALINRFESHPAAVTVLAASGRDKGFATGDAAGGVQLHHSTTGRTLLRLAAPESPRALVIAPKADAVLAVGASGRVAHWAVDNPHPEVTLETLFAPVWYEGYPGPDLVWQSTGGTDDFEPKLSLTPLVFGTVKGTLYALLFAVPLALLAALYVSEFMAPSLRAVVKPVVEIMAALPSVVLGFLAGLWLAPAIERVVPALVLLPLVALTAVAAVAVAWALLPVRLRQRVRPGAELVVLVPVVLLAGAAAFGLGAALERLALGGDYRVWLRSTLGLTYDQRNALVVGVAMGFAVIPIIFTIAEDALAGVPRHLRAGALALGATRWQTALRVVLPTAGPGIFSAVMIGFGRAVGETMIVLMATGNTPVMDWSPFSGFRALSANIAVELPEAPEGGTLFRVLFLAALLLFALTFAVNTAAEVVRLRLRRRYRAL
ncbi:MAG TPA: ABC transporter permease subunit [Calidithermus sp.]|nr:ABC transporter permease subunit [Calidithermus sp.]